MPHSYVQVPPDSTGKKVLSTERRLVTYDTLVTAFSVGDVVTGATSGASGTVTGIQTLGFPANEGLLYLEENTGTWQNNEFIQVNAVTYATVNTAGSGEAVDDVVIQNVGIADPDLPSNLAHVDRFGNMSINYEGQTPTVESQGELVTTGRVSVLTQVQDYAEDDIDIYDDEITLVYTSASTFTAGEYVYGETSGAQARVRSQDAGRNLLTLSHVKDNFSNGETIRSADDGSNSAIINGEPPTIQIDTTTRAVDISTGGTLEYLKAVRQTNQYIPAARNETTTVTFSLSSNPSDQLGVARRFGYFDDRNGFYFEILRSDGTDATYDASGGLDTGGQTVLCVAHRSDTTGAVVDDVIEQANFNVNRLDGTDATGFTLDITLSNLYWIDLPGSGSGSAKFGVYNDQGKRITAHTFRLNNQIAYPDNPTNANALPVRQEIVHHGGGTPGGITTMAIQRGHLLKAISEETTTRFHHGQATTGYEAVDDTTGEIPLLTIRARDLLNGITNRMTAVLDDIGVSLLDSRVNRTFNDADISTNQVTLKNHAMTTGDVVLYQQGSGGLTGLDDYERYWIIKVDDDTFSFATSYTNAKAGTVATLTPSTETGHTIQGLGDAPVLLRIRKNSHVADSTWSSHNTNRSGTEWADSSTGFRVSPFITIAGGGTGYTVGDVLELDASIPNIRQAVLEVEEVSAGVITRVRVLPSTGGHGTELDGSSNGNLGSYNGMIMGAVGHKGTGVGFSSTTGTSATFNVNVMWGHGFWWSEVYERWTDFQIYERALHSSDFLFYLEADALDGGNLTLTAEVVAEDFHNGKVTATMNWHEII